MNAALVSQTGEQIVLTIRITREELRDLAKGKPAAEENLVRTLLKTYTEAVGTPQVEEKREPSQLVQHPPFRARHYEGVRVPMIADSPGDDPVEDIKERILDRIIADNEMELPEEQLREEACMAFVGLSQNMKYRAMATGDLTEYRAFNSEENRRNVENQVIRQYQAEMILKSIIRQENLDVTREELEAEAAAMARRQNTTTEQVKRFFGEDLALVKNELLMKKAMELIYANAELT